jgi:hypothetical protein
MATRADIRAHEPDVENCPESAAFQREARGSQRLRAHLGQLRSVLIEALCPLLILAALLDCTHFVGWRSFVGRDAQIYSAVAGLWESGLMPYRDVYDFKPPGIFLAMRAGFPLWGHNAEALRRILMILTALSALVMYAGLRMAGYLIAAPFAALGIMTLVVPHPWHPLMQNPESIVAIFGTAAIGCAAAHQARPRAWLAVATGACLAAAMLGKQPAIFFSAPLMLQLWLWGSTGTWWKRLCYWGGRLFWAVAGFGAVVGLVAAYFAYRGALDALYQSVLVDGGRYVGLRVTDFFTPVGWRLFAQQAAPTHLFGWELAAGQVWPFFPFLAAILLLIPLTFTHPSRVVLLAWGWLVAMDCAVLVGAKPIGHQAIMAYPALALTVGIIFQLALGAALQPAWRQLATALLLAIFIYGGIWFTAYVPQRMDAPLEPDTYDPETIGERIRAAAHPGDKLLVLGELASVYLYAGQQPATRFIYDDPPNPRGNVERLQAMKSLPDFVLIPPHLRNFLKTGAFPPEFQPWVETLTQHYDEWFISPHNGSVYCRKTPLASHDEPQPEHAPGPGL